MATTNIKDIIIQEYKKCASDPVYFMKKYCKIQHPIKGKVLFDLYPFQENVLTELKNYDFNIILKSRQLGISTLSAGYSLWYMLFYNDKNILVLATKQEVAKNLVTKVRVMHDCLPSWLKGTCIEDNKLSLKFSNGSQIKAISSAGDSGRSEALSLLIIDEAAFIDNIEDIWTSAQSTLSTGGKCIVLSTPNGTGNWFHKMWVDAESKRNPFNTIRLKWTVHPDRDQAWRDKQTELLGTKEAAQECDADFISSGNTVLDGELLKWYETNHVREPIERRYIDSNLWIWEYPKSDKNYLVCADCARGDGNDYSAFHIIDIENMEQVASYKGQLTTKDYGNLLYNIATEYNDALLVVENANIGWATIQQILDRDYKNLYYTYKTDTYVDPDVQLLKNYDLKDKSQMVPGFTTSAKTRPMIISKIEQLFREKEPIVHCKRTISELYVFIWKNGRAEAQQGYNDDMVMSLGIGLWTRDTALRLKTAGMDLTRQTLSKIGKSTSIYSPKMFQQKNTGWSMNIDGKDEDLTWLV